MAISKRMAVAAAGLILVSGCGGKNSRTEVHRISPLTNQVDEITVTEKSPTSLYYETIQKMHKAMREQKPTLEISFEKTGGANHYQSVESLTRAIDNDFNDIDDLLSYRKSESYDINTIRNAVERLRSSITPALTTVFFAGVAQGGKNSILPVIKQRQPVDWRAVLALIKKTPTSGENWVKGLTDGLRNLGIPLAIATMGVMHVQSSRTSEEIAPDNTNTAGGDQIQGESYLDRSEKNEESFNTPETIDSNNTTTELVGTE